MSLADTNQEGLDAALKSISSSSDGAKHSRTVIDVRDSRQVTSWVEKTVAQHGRLDGAVNLAGVIKEGRRLREETDEGFDFSMDINTKGVFYCLRAELNNMKG